jgi:hypothetical protein
MGKGSAPCAGEPVSQLNLAPFPGRLGPETQSAGFDQTLAKARRQLSQVQSRLARGKGEVRYAKVSATTESGARRERSVRLAIEDRALRRHHRAV